MDSGGIFVPGEFSSQQYVAGAQRAFARQLINNTRYDDDGKENIIDDYGSLQIVPFTGKKPGNVHKTWWTA
ncbi:MAG: hypothetical protein ABIQ31_16500 [Ferruginibacter sp.]